MRTYVRNGGGRRQRIRVPAVAAEAYADRARFFAGQATSRAIDDDPTTIRVHDAAGAAIGVAKSPDVERRAEILRRRAGGALVRIGATLTSRLDPVALRLEHRTDELCLRVEVLPGDDAPRACRHRPAVVTLGGDRRCGRIPTTLVGFVPDGTRRLAVLLGSGRTARVSPQPAPLGQPGLIVAAVLPPGEAIRSATALDAAGHVRRRAALRVP
jgi:hypothetical protein